MILVPGLDLFPKNEAAVKEVFFLLVEGLIFFEDFLDLEVTKRLREIGYKRTLSSQIVVSVPRQKENWHGSSSMRTAIALLPKLSSFERATPISWSS